MGWGKAYNTWQREAMYEARALFPAFKGNKIEVGEDGRVYISGFINTSPETVTPWEQSPYYLP